MFQNFQKPTGFSFGLSSSAASTAQPSAFQFNPPQPIYQPQAQAIPPTIVPQTQIVKQPLDEGSNTLTLQQLHQSLNTPLIFNDSRDGVLKQWNQLLAVAGHGNGYYSHQAAPYNYTPDGLCAMLKTVCYNTIVKEKNEDGYLLIVCNNPIDKILKFKLEFCENFNKIMGNQPNITVNISNIKQVTDQKCCLTLRVTEKQSPTQSRIVPCNELMAFFAPHLPILPANSNQAQTLNPILGGLQSTTTGSLVKNQLQALAIEDIKPKIGPTNEEIQTYLANPPANFDASTWAKAIMENPDPANLIPVPVLGFSGLYGRLKAMQTEKESHVRQLEEINLSITQQKTALLNTDNKITSLTHKYRDLKHRLLKVKCSQDAKRLYKVPIQMFEVQLRNKLENIYNEMYTGELKELWSDISSRKQILETKSKLLDGESAKAQDAVVDLQTLDEFKKLIVHQQDCLDKMANVVKEDNKDISIIEQTLLQTHT